MKVLLHYSTLAILLLSFGWLVHSPGWEPAILFVGTLGAYLAQDSRFGRKASLEGRWEYIVVSANNRFSHKGECFVRQQDDVIQIQGVRRYTCIDQGQGDGEVYRVVHIAWNSEWAELCHDHVLRFEYVIALPDPKRGGQNIRATCRVEMTSATPVEMNGKFYVLPPFDESALNCNWGDLTLRRLAADTPLLPPEGFEPPPKVAVALDDPVPAYHG